MTDLTETSKRARHLMVEAGAKIDELREQNKELLEALKKAVRFTEACSPCYGLDGEYSVNHPMAGGGECPCACHDDDDWEDVARAAIAKAEGREE